MNQPYLSRRAATLALGAAAACAVSPVRAAGRAPAARYRVTLLGRSPIRFAVEAELPAVGERLTMGESWPAELPEMGRRGWPAVVTDLRASDTAGPLALTERRNHWTLDRPASGPVRLTYGVDLSVFEAAGWSSPLESAVADDDVFSVSGRALFITGTDVPSEVRYLLPPGWRSVMPWSRKGAESYAVDAEARLKDNMLAFSRRPPLTVSSAGFALQVVAMGHWRPLEASIRDALARIVRRETAWIGWRGRDAFNVILTPMADSGGEAYRQSLAMAFEAPTVANRPDWANYLAHEIFHYWNASRLAGADYASTQWFQEGFTEYTANLTLLATTIASPDWFLGKLSRHVANAARLETTMENIGTRKGPPLYSSGALVAFAFDTAIRRATGGRRDLGAMLRNLWRITDDASRPYAWPDIRLALAATAPGDWEGFYQRHIRGAEKMPLERVLAEAGLKLEGGVVRTDPVANAAARAVWSGLQR